MKLLCKAKELLIKRQLINRNDVCHRLRWLLDKEDFPVTDIKAQTTKKCILDTKRGPNLYKLADFKLL